jgi:hypothetical protein
MPLFPTHDSDPPASDYFTSPWPHPITGQKWTSELVGEETYRWTQYEEPPTPAITDAYTVSETAPSDTDLPWFDPSDGTWSVWNGNGWVVTARSSGVVGPPGTDLSPTLVTKHVTSGSYTVGTTNPLECYGGVIYVSGSATIVAPAVTAGMGFTVITVGAVAVSIDPNNDDLIRLDGAALDDGDKITNLSTSGDIATISYYNSTGWYAATNGWTDGGA